MIKWLDIELQLATLQILLDAELKRGEDVEKIDVSHMHEVHREGYLKYRREIAANDGLVTAKIIDELLNVGEFELERAIAFLTDKQFIEVFDRGLLISPEGKRFIIDELNKPRD